MASVDALRHSENRGNARDHQQEECAGGISTEPPLRAAVRDAVETANAMTTITATTISAKCISHTSFESVRPRRPVVRSEAGWPPIADSVRCPGTNRLSAVPAAARATANRAAPCPVPTVHLVLASVGSTGPPRDYGHCIVEQPHVGVAVCWVVGGGCNRWRQVTRLIVHYRTLAETSRGPSEYENRLPVYPPSGPDARNRAQTQARAAPPVAPSASAATSRSSPCRPATNDW